MMSESGQFRDRANALSPENACVEPLMRQRWTHLYRHMGRTSPGKVLHDVQNLR